MKNIVYLFAFIMLLAASCVKDRTYSVPDNTTKNVNTTGYVLLMYYGFNNGSATPLATPDFQLYSGFGLAYNGVGLADTAQPGSMINAQFGDTVSVPWNGSLRLRDPSGDFILTLPTPGYKNIVLKFVVQHTSKGSAINTITYSTDGTNFSSGVLAAQLGGTNVLSIDSLAGTSIEYQSVSLDFSSDTLVNNNANFKVKISFDPATAVPTYTKGNDRYDNITLWGKH
jgi:hypothetical protein